MNIKMHRVRNRDSYSHRNEQEVNTNHRCLSPTFVFSTSHTTVRAVPHMVVPILGTIRDTPPLKQHTLPYIDTHLLQPYAVYEQSAIRQNPLCSTQCIMASSSRTEAVARLGKLVLIDWSQCLVYGLLHQTVYYCWYSQQAHLAIVFGYFHPFHWVRMVRTVHQGTSEFLLNGQEPWE